MRIVLNTFGSFGDIHPYMAIAMELQSRGHTPVVATMEIYREKINSAGLEFAPVRPDIPQPKEQDPELIQKIMEPKTRQRDQLLSHFIDTAAYVYITQHNARAAAKG